MYITSLNGKRIVSVSSTTCDRVVTHITQHPFKTVVEYADEIGVSETVINLIIGRYLMKMATARRIAVSTHGGKPEWYYHMPNPLLIPRRTPVKRRIKPALRGIVDRQLRLDYSGLATQYGIATTRQMSPAKRKSAQREFVARLGHIGGNHQDNVSYVAQLEYQLADLRESMQLLASSVTNTIVKSAA